jgi:uncharacterized protein
MSIEITKEQRERVAALDAELRHKGRPFHAELRLDQKTGKPIIRGHAAVFNKLSENLGGFRERIRPGAFTRTLEKKPDVRALFNHDANYILGRTKSSTLRVSQDVSGLAYEIDPPNTSMAKDVVESISRGDIDQSSFGFYVITDEWHKEGGEMIRELVEIDLNNGDVSPVTYPAYPQTSVEARSIFPREVVAQPAPVTPVKLEEDLEEERERMRLRVLLARSRG